MATATSGERSHLSAKVFIGEDQTVESIPGTFSAATYAVTSTLIVGERDAVLVGAQHIKTDVNALGDMIEATGRRLTTIYVTHGHVDHFYGIGELIHRFPTARAVATAGVVEYIEKDKDNAIQTWQQMFGDRAVRTDIFPTPISGSIELEGNELRIVEVGQGDIEQSTVLHIPAIDTVVAGDVVYNKVHMMLGLSGPKEWELWIDSIDQIEKLKPKMIVAGHKRPEMPDTDAARMDESRAYIRAFAKASKTAANAEALIEAVSAKYPEFGNLWTLQFSARSYFEKRGA